MNPASTFSGKDFKKSSTCQERCYARSMRSSGWGSGKASAAKLENCRGIRFPSVEIETQHVAPPPEPCCHAPVPCSTGKSAAEPIEAPETATVRWATDPPEPHLRRQNTKRSLIKGLRRQWKKHNNADSKKVKCVENEKLAWNLQVETSAWQHGAEMNKVSSTLFQCAKHGHQHLDRCTWPNRASLSNRRPQQPLTLAASSCDPHGWCSRRPTRCVSSTHLQKDEQGKHAEDNDPVRWSIILEKKDACNFDVFRCCCGDTSDVTHSWIHTKTPNCMDFNGICTPWPPRPPCPLLTLPPAPRPRRVPKVACLFQKASTFFTIWQSCWRWMTQMDSRLSPLKMKDGGSTVPRFVNLSSLSATTMGKLLISFTTCDIHSQIWISLGKSHPTETNKCLIH